MSGNNKPPAEPESGNPAQEPHCSDCKALVCEHMVISMFNLRQQLQAAESRERKMREALDILTKVIRLANPETRWSANMKLAMIKADAALLAAQKGTA